MNERYPQIEADVHGTKLTVVLGDIVDQDVEAIVNAANIELKGGTGVDGAIHRAAGWRQLQEACRVIGYCETGDAVITDGFKLKAKHIIHTVGPFYVAPTYPMSEAARKHNERAARLLASCYQSCLELAKENGIRTIAFPAISAGVFGYPIDEATPVAVSTVLEFLRFHRRFNEVLFVVDYDEAFGNYKRAFG